MRNEEKLYTLSHTLMLLVASFFWGTTFVAQSLGAEYVGPGTYLALRTYIGIAFLLPFVLYRDRKENKNISKEDRRREMGVFIKGGMLANVIKLR